MRDMTKGSISQHMLQFTVPLLLSNVFQQLYITADIIIVGRYLGKESLAAVGSAGAIMNVLLFLLIGVSIGTSVLIAQYYGSDDKVLVKKELGTALTAGLLFTVCLTVVALFGADWALKVIQTPDEIMQQASAYLRIIIAGLVFTFLYNMLAAALRALGDAKIPVLILFACAFTNIALDIFFIGYLSMGVQGAALATVISQALAFSLCGAYIFFKVPIFQLTKNEFRMDISLLGQTVEYSGIYAIQQCVVYLGVFFVQGTVNTLGIDAMAAYNAVTKIDSFALLPGDSLAASFSTFVAQNKGAKKDARIFSSLKFVAVIGLCFCGILALLLPFISDRLMQLFLEDYDYNVVSLGVSYLSIMSLLYPLTAICNSFQGLFRGLGNMRITLIATLIQIPIRVILATLLSGYFYLNAIPIATGIGWSCMIVYE